MVFSSFPFIFGFMPIALLGFLINARISHKAAALWLVLASLGFYAYWRVEFLPLLLMSIAFNFVIGSVLAKTGERPRLQLTVFLLGVVADLLALIYYKYVAALAASLGFNSLGGTLFENIILPLGISFFNFTQIG